MHVNLVMFIKKTKLESLAFLNLWKPPRRGLGALSQSDARPVAALPLRVQLFRASDSSLDGLERPCDEDKVAMKHLELLYPFTDRVSDLARRADLLGAVLR